MRVTKAWVRGQRLRLEERVKTVFKMTDEEVTKFLKYMFPNAVPETREENIKVIMLLSLEEFLPDVYLQ